MNNLPKSTCKKCGEIKLLTDFVKDSGKKTGYREICKICRNLYLKNRYENKKEEVKEYQKIWRRNNIEKVKGYNRRDARKRKSRYTSEELREKARERYHKNEKKSREILRNSYYRNKEKRLEYARNYNKNNKERRRTNARFNGSNRRALMAKAKPPWLNDEHMYQIKLMHLLAKKLESETGKRFSVDHIHPLINSNFCGLHVPWNLQVIPSIENSSKSNKFKPELGLTA